jgi:hypothetical protein
LLSLIRFYTRTNSLLLPFHVRSAFREVRLEQSSFTHLRVYFFPIVDCLK